MPKHIHHASISEAARKLIEEKQSRIEESSSGKTIFLPDEAEEEAEPCDGGIMYTWTFPGGDQLTCWHGPQVNAAGYDVLRRRR